MWKKNVVSSAILRVWDHDRNRPELSSVKHTVFHIIWGGGGLKTKCTPPQPRKHATDSTIDVKKKKTNPLESSNLYIARAYVIVRL